MVVWLVLALCVVNVVGLACLLLRRSDPAAVQAAEKSGAVLGAAIQAGAQSNAERLERLERELRREVNESSRSGRQEQTQTLATFQQSLVQQGAEATRTQNTQIDAFGQQLSLLQKTLSDTLSTQLSGLSESNARRMTEVRETL